MSTASFSVVVACWTFGAISVGAHFLPQAGPRERVIAEQPGVSVRSRLLPDDETVVIRRTGDIDFVVPDRPPTVSQAIRYAAHINDAILVVTVRRQTGELSEDESWVNSSLEGTIREVFKGPKNLSPGQQVTVTYVGGGETVVGRVRVKAGKPFPVDTGKPCLMFLAVTPSGLVENSTMGIEGTKLVSFSAPEPDGKKGLWDGLSLERVAREIRDYVRKNRE